jgi:hypothetical protein
LNCVSGDVGYIDWSVAEHFGYKPGFWTEVCEQGPFLVGGEWFLYGFA